MEFQNDVQKQCYEKVSTWLREIFGELAIRVREEYPVIDVIAGSSVTHVSVDPWGDDDTVVMARSYVVRGIELTADLLEYLLRKNNEVRFGAFSIDKDNDIAFDITIVGSTIDREELKAAVLAVSMTADRLDDEIVAKWGGQSTRDFFRNRNKEP